MAKQEQPPVKKALFEKVAEDLIKRLEEGTAPWQKPWGNVTSLLPYNPTTGNNYKGLNTFALMMENRDDPRWMTFKQADANKWQVNKGEKGTLINFYKFDEQKALRDDKGKPVLDEKGKQKYITVKREKPIITAAWVFNAEQIKGIPPLVIEKPENKWEAIEAVEKIVSNSGAKVTNVPGDRAFYTPMLDYIQMPVKEQFPDPGLYYATLLHELGHWTGHKDRLDRDILNQFGTENYAKEELRAEIGSYMLGTDLKIGHDPERHAAYVASWVKALKDDPYEIHRAAADAQKIFDYVKGFERKIEIEEEFELTVIDLSQKVKPSLSLNQQISYKGEEYKVMALLRQGSLRMENLTSGQVFKLTPTDGLYKSLLNAVSPSLDNDIKNAPVAMSMNTEPDLQLKSLKR